MIPFPYQTGQFGRSVRRAGGLDPDFASNVLLLHMDGANGSTTFTDNSNSAKVPTVVGNAQISTAQSKFGGASGLFDGSGDYLSYANNADWTFGTGSYTIEMWARITSLAAFRYVLGRGDGGAGGYLDMYVFTNGAVYANAYLSTGIASINSAASVFVINTWHHIAFVRDGTTFYLYVDGVSRGTPVTSSLAMRTNNSTMVVGATGLGLNGMLGNLDDVRITKGVARYPGGTTFTPPTAPFPDS